MSQQFLFDGVEIDYVRQTSYNDAMMFFENTANTESAFYLRFQVMPLEHKKSLFNYYNTTDDWKIFKEICKFYKI